MKNPSKIIIALIITILVITVVMALLPDTRDVAQDPVTPQSPVSTVGEAPSETVDPGYINNGLQTDPTAEPYVQPTFPASDYQSIQLSDNVTVTQIPIDPSVEIPYGKPITEDDPEYLNIAGGDLYATIEGKVYRNDKTISIKLYDEMNGEYITVSFGHITSEYNRFLYLNPVIKGESERIKYGCRFYTTSGGGLVTNMASCGDLETDEGYARYESVENYEFYEAMNLCADANYKDPTHPGSVWYADTPVDGGCYIYVNVYQANGDFLAVLRLTIAKDEDNTYAIVNLEDMNLLTLCETENPAFTRAELQYLYEIALADIRGGGKLDSSVYVKPDVRMEEVIMNYHTEMNGLYLPFYIPRADADGWRSVSRDALYNPVVSISFRWWAMSPECLTLYYSVQKAPSGEDHGEYEFLGIDYRNYKHSNNLKNQGYPLN